MISMRFLLLSLFLLAGLGIPAQAQEFNCSVNVDTRAISGSDYRFLNDLGVQIDEYINDRSWTEHRFQEFERIDCTIQVTIEEATSLSSFRARLIVASRRPIYGTSQSSTIAQFNDAGWSFPYTQGSPLIFNLEQYDPLTSVLDFYAMLLLGYDFDTFEPRGGQPFFERARRIAELGQAQNAPGWTDATGERGRVDLVRELLDPRFVPLREAYFRYHFEGLDHFVLATNDAREAVVEVLDELNELFIEVSRRYSIDLFFNAKYQELAALFEGSPHASRAYELLTRIDPSHMTDYDRLVR
jgi:hypothetical protein